MKKKTKRVSKFLSIRFHLDIFADIRNLILQIYDNNHRIIKLLVDIEFETTTTLRQFAIKSQKLK